MSRGLYDCWFSICALEFDNFYIGLWFCLGLMEEKRVREILELGARVYSARMAPGLRIWAKEFPAEKGEREFLDFYVEQVEEMNSRGASGRVLGIASEIQDDIFSKYMGSLEDL